MSDKKKKSKDGLGYSKDRIPEYVARGTVAATIGGVSVGMYLADKKPKNMGSKKRGLKVPTKKLSEKVMLRAIKNVPEFVHPTDERKFKRVYDSHSKRHGLSKKVMKAGYKAAYGSNVRTMGKAFVGGFVEGINKARRLTAAGIAAEILRPKAVGDATIQKGLKYKEFKRK
jgi:hypothetical protein|tara:strand:- start:463 stop:975 length:513 start_codon:yes stop_codon:yes gene_type:complete